MHTQGIASSILPVHILAGGLALVFGYVALFARKGATLHRKSGMLFVRDVVLAVAPPRQTIRSCHRSRQRT